MAARFLGMDAQTWDRQPYWAQRIYMEGLEIERPWQIKLNPDPQTWWSPIDSCWDSFGELPTQKEGKEPTTDTPTGTDNDIPVSSSSRTENKLKDITYYGAPVTRISLPKNRN